MVSLPADHQRYTAWRLQTATSILSLEVTSVEREVVLGPHPPDESDSLVELLHPNVGWRVLVAARVPAATEWARAGRTRLGLGTSRLCFGLANTAGQKSNRE